ncbi:MAG: hypothetical protein M1837_002863 [Sclerophora amabilis]|nr:MAG: hypothetical protein M1837_002863 [Sclerophora amabilis]
MPSVLDDPSAATIYRMSGAPPYPTPYDPQLPSQIYPRQVTLRDRITIATLIPFSSPHQLPPSLLAYLCDQLNREIELGDTYPMIDPMPLPAFGPYWFANFGAVMLLGKIDRASDVRDDKDWTKDCLGSFYVKPNYPGRSSHVCNGGFLVTDASRNRGVGRLMGECYLEWAPMLGYTYSVFNLVYETNVASCRIWDALGFKRIGRVKGCGNLNSYPGQLIDAIIYGRDLGPEGEDFVSEERFDKIKFYLKHGKYPSGADRAEKSRLRSAATHYKLLDGDKLMLKDKEVVSDPQRQYEIARAVHVQQHGGINKTTATIAEKYHWVRIKETVSLVIRNCTECKEMAKAPVVRNDGGSGLSRPESVDSDPTGIGLADRVLGLPNSTTDANSMQMEPDGSNLTSPPSQPHLANTLSPPRHHPHHSAPVANMQHHLTDYSDIPLDPQIMEDMGHHLSHYAENHSAATDPHGPFSTHHPHSANNPHLPSSSALHHHAHTDYQALLSNVDAPSDEIDDTMMDHGTAHHPHASSSQPHHHNIMLSDGNAEMMAAKATAAARAARDAMVDEDENVEMKRHLQRQLMGAGFGGHRGNVRE